ncbi:MAG: hypothetical protein KAR47_05055 [Planctomycetes bacterium]|nr:hypothetical protein [Planctomycetota bacterium]
MKRCLPFLVLVIVLVGTAGFCLAYPKPALVPARGDWTVEVDYSQPMQINLNIPGEDQGQAPKRFWYIILTLTNNSTTDDAAFYPVCELMTDTFQIIPAGKDTRQVVFDQIKLRHQGRYPFLESLDYVDNRILQGRDNSKDIAIIWPDFDPKAKDITLFIAGLSNETVAVDHPIEIDDQGNPQKVYLRKTLALEYGIGTDPALRAKANLAFKDKNWVMR